MAVDGEETQVSSFTEDKVQEVQYPDTVSVFLESLKKAVAGSAPFRKRIAQKGTRISWRR